MSITADKISSATAALGLSGTVNLTLDVSIPRAGDVIAVRALSESITYGNIELPSGQLARISRGDVLIGVLGTRRALKGFVGDVPASLKVGDRLHLLNMGGVIGQCSGHHSSVADAIELEVIGAVADENNGVLNIDRNAIPPAQKLDCTAPVIIVAGTCMNSGKTAAAVELIKQASRAGLRVAGGKISGVACLRDTLNMRDHGAVATASFLDCGLPSTAGYGDLAPVAKAILNHLSKFSPDLIVAELGDGVVGDYSVDSVLKDAEIRRAASSVVFCASDYVGVVGGISVMANLGLNINVVAGSVTDSQMGEDFVQAHYRINAGNARRDGRRLFDLAAESCGLRLAAARREPVSVMSGVCG